MADITMCHNPGNCPKKDTCYRSTAIPDRLQSYADFAEHCKETNYNNYWSDAGYPTRKNINGRGNCNGKIKP